MADIKWCFRVKDGIKIKEPSSVIAGSFQELAKATLKSAETMLKARDLLWTTVMIYYADYYALSSFIAKIGIKCENHVCSILLVKELLGYEKLEILEEHRKKRIDAQYFLKIGKEQEVKAMLKQAKFFVAELDALVSGLAERDVQKYRKKLFVMGR